MGKYFIDNTELKLIHKVMLEILIEIDKIAKIHKINYILDGGTLLGAVRNKGFIEWDDDLDIAMLRKDYNRLRKACMKELNINYFWQDNRTEKNFPLDIAKVMNLNTTYVEKIFYKLSKSNGVFIDIFPVDNVIPKLHKIQCFFVRSLQRIRREKMGIRQKREKWYENFFDLAFVKMLLYVCPVRFLNFSISVFCQIFNLFPTRFVNKLSHGGVNQPIFKREFFNNTVMVKFENQFFPCPKDYHNFLTLRFGDYFTPPLINNRKPSHNIVKCNLCSLKKNL